jgi:hypothetical protein
MKNGDKEFQFIKEEIKLLERMEHRHWMAEKTISGWIHAPGKKDPQKKPILILCRMINCRTREKIRTKRQLKIFQKVWNKLVNIFSEVIFDKQ